MDRKKAADLAYAEGYRLGSASRDTEIQRLQFALADSEALELGTAERCDQLRAEIAELEGKNYLNSNALRLQKEKNDQLRAQINMLREALQFLIATKELKESVGKTPEYEQMRIIAWGKATVALSSTPEQSLAAYRNKVIEDCAVLCEKSDRYRGAYFAEKLRAMKEAE